MQEILLPLSLGEEPRQLACLWGATAVWKFSDLFIDESAAAESRFLEQFFDKKLFISPSLCQCVATIAIRIIP